MGVIVIKQRVDTGERVYLPGETIVDLNEKDEKELVDLGVCSYVKEDKEPEDNQIPDFTNKTDDLPEGLVQVARGWYQLPNGEKVQGKAKAIETLESYNQELEVDEEEEDSDAEGELNEDGPNKDLPL